jgi:hypothetical protein
MWVYDISCGTKMSGIGTFFLCFNQSIKFRSYDIDMKENTYSDINFLVACSVIKILI